MKYLKQIEELMKSSKSIDELINAIKQSEIPAFYMRQADDSIKMKLDISIDEKWHRFFVETSSTPINRWENMPHYSQIVISDNLDEIKILKK